MGKYPEVEAKMEKRIQGYASELKTIRAGRANASVLDKVYVEYYGTNTPIQQVGSISSPTEIACYPALGRHNFEGHRKGYKQIRYRNNSAE